MNLREKALGLLKELDLQDAFVFGGLLLVTVGSYQIYAPAGWLVPGAALMALGLIRTGGPN